jgi:succinate dehydrogenase / fumarate reductase flavoprotein subunit
MLDRCGNTRTADGLRSAMSDIAEIRERFWADLRVEEGDLGINQTLEYAGRVADFLEFAGLMCRDALEREESCGCHLREEYKTAEGEAVRDDGEFAHVAIWEHTSAEPIRHVEQLAFENVTPVTRSYK